MRTFTTDKPLYWPAVHKTLEVIAIVCSNSIGIFLVYYAYSRLKGEKILVNS